MAKISKKLDDVQLRKKLKLTEYRLNMGLMNYTVLCVIGEFKPALEYTAWKMDDPGLIEQQENDGDVALGKCWCRPGYVPIVWIPKKPKTHRELATFAHECGHAIFRMFDWAGVNINVETEEFFLHAQAHLVNGFLEQIYEEKR